MSAFMHRLDTHLAEAARVSGTHLGCALLASGTLGYPGGLDRPMPRRALLLLFSLTLLSCSRAGSEAAPMPIDKPASDERKAGAAVPLPGPCGDLPWAPGPSASAPDIEVLRRALDAFALPWNDPHAGYLYTHASAAAYQAGYRRALRALAPYATGNPSGLERAWMDPERRLVLMWLLAPLAFDDFPPVIRGEAHLNEPALLAPLHLAAARLYCRGLLQDEDPTLRNLLLDPLVGDRRWLTYPRDGLERLGLGGSVTRLLTHSDPETRRNALVRLAQFAEPPRDDATVDGVERALRDPELRRARDSQHVELALWLLAEIGTDRAVDALIDALFTRPVSPGHARCALDRVIEPRHAERVRAAYAEGDAGYPLPHPSPVRDAAPFLTRLGLEELVARDLRAHDGDRVARGLQYARHLPRRAGAPLLREVIARRDLPVPPDGERRPWGNDEGLRNSARDGLAWIALGANRQSTGSGCESRTISGIPRRR